MLCNSVQIGHQLGSFVLFFKIFKYHRDIRYGTFLIHRIINFHVRYILILELKKINLFFLIYEIMNLYVRYILILELKKINLFLLIYEIINLYIRHIFYIK